MPDPTPQTNTPTPRQALSAPPGSAFSYFRYPEWDKPFFEVEADGILEADDKLKAETGIVAAKNPNVGCKIFSQNTEVAGCEPATPDQHNRANSH